MDPIIGRKQEIQELEELYSSNQAEFISVYGRRRVGKTYLIKNFFKAKDAIFFHITGVRDASIDVQLNRFSKTIGEIFYHGTPIKTAQTWMDAFDILNIAIEKTPKTNKIIIFFDELPWLATPKSGLIQAIEYFWNRHWVDNKNLKLVVCGSSASWIIKNIIKNRGGLHNRTTARIKLMPFTLHETKLFLEYLEFNINKKQLLKIYMAIGGIPFYIKQLNKKFSVDRNIDQLFFNPNNIFFNEFEEVFASLFDEFDIYKELVTLISTSRQGFARKELEKKAKLTGKGGRLTQRLSDLEACGFISSYIPLGHTKRGTYYRISDEYCYFYLKWVDKAKYLIKQGYQPGYWQSQVTSQVYKSWAGYAFENVCYKHLSVIRKALYLPEGSLGSSWRYSPIKNDAQEGAQIDLLFLHPDKNVITLCEIKNTDEPYLLSRIDYENILKKLMVYERESRRKAQCYFAIISVNGVKQNEYLKNLSAEIVTIDNFFEHL